MNVRKSYLSINVEVETTDNPDKFLVFSNYLVYRNRVERDEDTLTGNCMHIWGREEGISKLARHRILLKQSVLLSKK